MATTPRPRRVFAAGVVLGVASAFGALQLAPIVAGALAPAAIVVPGGSSTHEYRAIYEWTVAESGTDEYVRSYIRSTDDQPATSTEEYRAMYENR
ncbi:MAG TPA: hypothetical protein VKA85_00950 [Candidatus Limnocylindrales bacterium]|nr:hypothetical protein [Candidatus Limnocylindrales bacterium]